MVDEELPHWDPPAVRRRTLEYDAVIRCTGWRYAPHGLFEEGGAPRLDERGKFFELDSTWQTSVPDLYCIGTSMQCRDRKAATSFIHGFRYNVRTLFRLLEERHHGVAFPSLELPLGDADDLDRAATVLLRRMSLSSALYQQFGVMCDALVFREGRLVTYPELPVDYVRERAGLGDAADLVLLTLEYGFHRYPASASTLDFLYAADPSNADCSAFLHPVLRHYRSGRLENEVHLGESIDIRYDYETFRDSPVMGHKSRVKNFLNSVARVTRDAYFEDMYAGVFVAADRLPWTGSAPTPLTDAGGEATCQFVAPPR